MKISLDTKILNIKGEPITSEEPQAGTTNRVLQQLASLPTADAIAVKEQIIKWQKELKETVKKEQTVRDYLLILLGSRFDLEDKRKEVFWVSDLGILFADSKNREADVSEEKLTFLRRIVEKNTIKRAGPMGEDKELELFFPFELGQILKALDGEGVSKKEKTDKEEK